MSDSETKPSADWRQRSGLYLRDRIIAGDDRLDAARQRLRARLGWGKPLQIAAYRGYGDAEGVELMGRVLAQKSLGGPLEEADNVTRYVNMFAIFFNYFNNEQK